MEADAIVLMLVGMVVIWGGFAASVLHAVRTSRAARREERRASPPGE